MLVYRKMKCSGFIFTKIENLLTCYAVKSFDMINS